MKETKIVETEHRNREYGMRKTFVEEKGYTRTELESILQEF